MPLETALYIDTLQPDWPLGTDPESQGDDHLRMLKQVLQNTFPNLTEAVTGSAAALNGITDHFHYNADNTVNGGTPESLSATNAAQDNYIPVLVGGFTNAVAVAQANAMAISFGWVMNNIYPVGSTILNSGTNPATILGFGTWTQYAGALYGVGHVTDRNDGATAWDIPSGTIVGSLLVDNANIRATDLAGSGTAASAGAHTHTYNLNFVAGSAGPDGAGDQQGPANTSSAGDHTHSVSVSTRMGTGLQIFNNPGYGLYVWVRTA